MKKLSGACHEPVPRVNQLAVKFCGNPTVSQASQCRACLFVCRSPGWPQCGHPVAKHGTARILRVCAGVTGSEGQLTFPCCFPLRRPRRAPTPSLHQPRHGGLPELMHCLKWIVSWRSLNCPPSPRLVAKCALPLRTHRPGALSPNSSCRLPRFCVPWPEVHGRFR